MKVSKMEIRWTSLPTLEQDMSIAEEILEHVMNWLDGFNPDVSVELHTSD